MTIISYKNGIVASDRAVTNSSMMFEGGPKIRRIPNGDIIASVGDCSSGSLKQAWYEEGGHRDKFPKSDKECFARLLVIKPNGTIMDFDDGPIPTIIKEPFMAWGSGRDFAIGAMASGASAEEAVRITCRFATECGCGIDVLHIKEAYDPANSERPLDEELFVV